MARYIDAESFEKRIDDIIRNAIINKDDTNVILGDFVLKLIKDCPTADVEPVVHCKDCKYWCHRDGKLEGRCVDAPHIDGDDFTCLKVNANDFCSYGAKMDKEVE